MTQAATTTMNAPVKRPWYRLHWGTWLVVLFVGMRLANLALPSTIGVGRLNAFVAVSFTNGQWWRVEGWPLICLRLEGKSIDCEALPLAINCGLTAVCLASVAFVLRRAEQSGPRFRISTVLRIVAASAAICAFWRWDVQMASDLERYMDEGPHVRLTAWRTLPLSNAGWYSIVPALFALGCLAYTTAWLLESAAIRGIRVLRRPTLAKVETDVRPPK